MNAASNEQNIRLQIAALVHREGFAKASRMLGLTRHQLMGLSGGHRVHVGTMVQAQTALAVSSLPTVGDNG